MQVKKKQILEAAIRCFARKGFNATSIQEIVDELGMAKGSIYFYFKSKDAILISIFEYYGEMMFDHMDGLPEEAGFLPREKLALQIERQFSYIRQHLDFMRMLIKEPLTGLHPQIQEMMIRVRARFRLWNVSHLLAIYGSSIEACLGDASALLSGIIGQYFEAVMFDEGKFDDQRLSRFLVRRLDDMVTGMQQAAEGPIMPQIDLVTLRSLAGFAAEEGAEEAAMIQNIIDEVITTGVGPSWDERTYSDLLAALALIKEEIAKPVHKNYLLVRGMVSLLKEYGPDRWHESLELLEQRFVQWYS